MYVRSLGFGATRTYRTGGRGFRGIRGFRGLTSPIAGSPVISSLFGPRAQPTAGASTDHQGIDYAVPVGTPVLAAGAGTVTFAGVQSGFGNTVVIDNGNGTSTLYGHLSSIGVSQGQTVGDGDQIALSGATGTVSGPNLHFGVYENGVAIDPTTQLLPTLDLTGDVSSTDTTVWDSLFPSLSTDLTDLTGGTDSTGTASVDPVMIAGIALLAALGLGLAVSS